MRPLPTHEDFRAIGFTIAAAQFPRTPESLFWLIRFNGADPYRWTPPGAWWFSPNAWMLDYTQRRAESELTAEEIAYARANMPNPYLESEL